MTDRQLLAFIPACVAFDWAQISDLSDVAFILQHEIDLFEEGQDGALSAKDIRVVRKALGRVTNRIK
jgi:hypothetical protein